MLTILQTSGDYSRSSGPGLIGMLFFLLLALFFGYCMYKIFKRAGKENAWMGFIPILNYIPLLEIAKKPLWWILLMFIPIVNVVIAIIVWMRVAKAFGKSDAYGILVPLLSPIMLPVFAFGKDPYNPSAVNDETGKAF